MLGAIAGDIIASPYIKNYAQSKDFRMFTSVRGWSSGEEVTFFPRVTDASVMTLAVARWLATDPEHRKASFISIMTDLHSKHPDCEYSQSGCLECRSVMMLMKLAFRCSGSVANHRATARVITLASVTLGKKVTSSPDDHPRTLVNILKSLL